MPLPRHVRRFLADHVGSVGDLELLMLLHGDRERVWSSEELCDVLRCPPNWPTARLQAMAAAGLVVRDETGWRFHPADDVVERAADDLAHEYRARTRDVVRFIFSAPGGGVTAFADAFRLRRDDEDR